MHLVGTFLESTGMIGKMVEEHTKCVGKNCKPQTYDRHIFPNKIETCSLAIFFLFFLISKMNSYENFFQKYKIKITFRNVFHDSSLFKRLKPYPVQNPAKILTRGPYSVYPGVSNSELSIQAQSRHSINLGSSNEYMFKYLFLQFSSSAVRTSITLKQQENASPSGKAAGKWGGNGVCVIGGFGS